LKLELINHLSVQKLKNFSEYSDRLSANLAVILLCQKYLFLVLHYHS
jgi:hypothetical protein